MPGQDVDIEAWLRRISYAGPREPTLATLCGIVAAHATTIPYETVDPLLGRPPSLDVGVLQRKMIADGRGGYCFEQNTLLRAGLRSMGFTVTGLQARVVRNLAVDAERPAFHMVLRVDLPEGPFLADVGFGNLAPTAPLALRPLLEQATPHEVMRFVPLADGRGGAAGPAGRRRVPRRARGPLRAGSLGGRGGCHPRRARAEGHARALAPLFV